MPFIREKLVISFLKILFFAVFFIFCKPVKDKYFLTFFSFKGRASSC